MKINIADTPTKPRDHSKLMVIDRQNGKISHHKFYELPKLLKPSDVLVFNNSKVIPARLYGHKSTGGKVEILLLRKRSPNEWEFISHPGLKPGQKVIITPKFQVEIVNSQVLKIVNFNSYLISRYGRTPLPPYIKSDQKEAILRKQYQTVYAANPGSSAAPTAGLHFTNRLINKLRTMNYELEYITLHVGLGTFKPPTPEQIKTGVLHSEFYTLDANVARRLNKAKSSNRRIIAVGTTTCRVLETCSDASGKLHAQTGDTNIFIQPGYKFKFIDGLITNFHLPDSSLIMLVSAFASPSIIKTAYSQAISHNYRFYSFGDSSLII